METIAAELVETGAKKDARGRRLAVREEAQAALAAYERSGLTQREFARREGIKFFTFTGWLKRYRQAGEKPTFAEVRVAKPTPTPKATPRSKLTVKLPSGLVVRGTDAGQMAELIKRLGC
jgi:transposase-like protein